MLKLSANEARVIGCLMEKSVTTPDQYPLTLNSLTSACNQKSSRDPVMALDKGVVQRTANELRDKHLLRGEENFKTGMERYLQRFCNTQLADYQFDSAQFAIICLMLLRGAHTPGELRARSGRLHTFADNEAVEDALTTLFEWQGNPLVAQLPRTPGRRDAEYMHLFFGPIDVTAQAAPAKATTNRAIPTAGGESELELRVSKLEAEVAELKARLQQEK